MERHRTSYWALADARSDVMKGVYAWMSGGLALTALVSLLALSSHLVMQTILGDKVLFYGLILCEIGLVFSIRWAIDWVTPFPASLLFLAFAALNGLTMSMVFAAYTSASIASTFVIAS